MNPQRIYNKPPLSIKEQIERLRRRGLTIDDDNLAESFLNRVSFYRFRAYTYPFQDNTNSDHLFVEPVSFSDIVSLYDFDAKLRKLVFGALAQIEVAVRTQIIYQWSISRGSNWLTDDTLFKNVDRHRKSSLKIEKEIIRSSETFIRHYKATYSIPKMPPSWISLEVASFGVLSKLFQNLRSGSEKKAVARFFGLNGPLVLENWMHSFNNVRNVCAHHGRLWNRSFPVPITVPRSTPRATYANHTDREPYKLYAVLTAVNYLLNVLGSCESNFNMHLKQLIESYPIVSVEDMGFPVDWKNDVAWQ